MTAESRGRWEMTNGSGAGGAVEGVGGWGGTKMQVMIGRFLRWFDAFKYDVARL